jgi:uncharacterized protein YjiS (DUF1127 family)
MIMSTLALWSADAASTAIETRPKPSLFQRLIKAREREATRRVHTFLLTLSDERLRDLGYTREDIAALRDGQVRMPR